MSDEPVRTERKQRIPRLRQQRILSLLAERGMAGFRELAAELAVSTMTVRRDAEVLIAQGSAVGVDGGLSHHSPRGSHGGLSVEQVIGLAVDRVQPGDLVFVDGGPIAVEVARRVDPEPDIGFVVRDVLIAHELASLESEIILLSGKLAGSIVAGPLTRQAADQLAIDLAIIELPGEERAATFTAPASLTLLISPMRDQAALWAMDERTR